MGASHEVHGPKIRGVVCAIKDTRATPEGKLLRAFWKMQDVEHMPLPRNLKKTEIPRLQGVYSKLQACLITRFESFFCGGDSRPGGGSHQAVQSKLLNIDMELRGSGTHQQGDDAGCAGQTRALSQRQ